MKTLTTLTTYNGNKITSRAIARIAKAELSKQGIFAQVVDKGTEADQRWGVSVVSKQTLCLQKAPQRANNSVFMGGQHIVCRNGKTSQNWLSGASRKNVDVYFKKHVNLI